VHESISVYASANKRADAESVYTNNLLSGAFRGYGLGVGFAIESRMDELKMHLGMDPFGCRRNVVAWDDMVVVEPHAETDLIYGYLVRAGPVPRSGAGRVGDSGPATPDSGWRASAPAIMALAMIASLRRGQYAAGCHGRTGSGEC
jgi:hypothetical protein